MATAYGLDRCDARLGPTKWGQCTKSRNQVHSLHRDEAGNNFIIDKGTAHVVDAHGRWLS